jgi:hypothetical protein
VGVEEARGREGRGDRADGLGIGPFADIRHGKKQGSPGHNLRIFHSSGLGSLQ